MKTWIKFAAGLALAAGIGTSAAASTVSIDFNGGVDGALVGGFYSGLGVTFSNAEFTDTIGLTGSSAPLGVRAPGTYDFDATDAVTGTFSGTASFVTIRAIDDGFNGVELRAFDASHVLLGVATASNPTDGSGLFDDLTVTASGIKSFQFSQIVLNPSDGVIFDDFSFGSGGRSAAPEPAAWALMISGFGLAGVSLRRRRAIAA